MTVDIQNLDLNELENSATSYFSKKEDSSDQDLPVHRRVMDGIFPVLEAISSGESQALFKRAMDSKKLSLAAIICDPPAIGISFPVRPDGELVKLYDAKHAGRAFRAVCVGFSEKNYPLAVADILSKEVGAEGLSYGPSTLVKNGIAELSSALARSRLDAANPSVEQRFACLIFSSGDKTEGSFRQLSDLIRREMLSAHLNEGRFYKSKDYFQLIEDLSGNTPAGDALTLAAFKDCVTKELSNASSNNVELLIALLLTQNDPMLDRYRIATLKSLDDNHDLSDFLKGSFQVIGKLKGVGKYMESISEIYVEAGYAALTDGIKDSSDYQMLADMPNIDISRISPRDIPRHARGAALERELGL